MSFRDLDADGSPELLLSLYTQGAHCCFVTQIFNFAHSPPAKLEHDWGDTGGGVVAIGGRALFKSADDSFAYAFTDYADSDFPILFLAYDGRHLVNVTRNHPALISVDARLHTGGASSSTAARGVTYAVC